GIIQRLAKLDVAQRRNLLQGGLDLLAEGAVRGEILAVDGDFDGRWRTEAHHAADDIAWFERETDSRQLLRENFSQALFEFLDANRSAFLQLHLQHAFLRAAVPEVNEVHRIRRPMHAQETQRD